MNLYERLRKEQRPTDYQKSTEALYFAKHSLLLSSIDIFKPLAKAAGPFDVIRANIVLRSLANKEKIEREARKVTRLEKNEDALSPSEFIEGILNNLPYLKVNGTENYVPILPESLASLYSRDFLKLEKEPYRRLLHNYQAILVDPFDLYGYHLFDSYFTSLVPIAYDKKAMAAFDFDANRLYFINDEGRLDDEIALFDRRLEKVSKTHLAVRLKRVASAYFYFDRDALLKALVEENLVSNFLIQDIAKDKREGK